MISAGWFFESFERFASLTSAPTYRDENSTSVAIAPPEPPPDGDDPNGETASPTNARLAVITPVNGARMIV